MFNIPIHLRGFLSEPEFICTPDIQRTLSTLLRNGVNRLLALSQRLQLIRLETLFLREIGHLTHAFRLETSFVTQADLPALTHSVVIRHAYGNPQFHDPRMASQICRSADITLCPEELYSPHKARRVEKVTSSSSRCPPRHHQQTTPAAVRLRGCKVGQRAHYASFAREMPRQRNTTGIPRCRRRNSETQRPSR